MLEGIPLSGYHALLWIHSYIHTYPHSQLKHSHFPALEGEIFTPLPLRDLSRNSPKLVRNFPKLNLTLPFMDLKHARMYIPLHLWILTYILRYVSGHVIYAITSISHQLSFGGILPRHSELAERACRLQTTS